MTNTTITTHESHHKIIIRENISNRQYANQITRTVQSPFHTAMPQRRNTHKTSEMQHTAFHTSALSPKYSCTEEPHILRRIYVI
ncbi:hypothetical protein E2C01_071960 [Portunus trituberculatus]|uniref:Uncharacterized protein n=1 Tax=Portunus trituberculatus TaxID=210409 RepID=A0A5B7I9U1_PORTR|nr:hypothetical protein [Portunus trituberculatus]